MEDTKPEITASRMREIAEKNIGINLAIEIAAIENKIQEAAKSNLFSVKIVPKISNAASKALESREFKIAHDSGWIDSHDPKESVPTSTTISW